MPDFLGVGHKFSHEPPSPTRLLMMMMVMDFFICLFCFLLLYSIDTVGRIKDKKTIVINVDQ